MDKIIRNILRQIENEGYEAYIVGGFVRDKLLQKNSYDVDICTNALPKDLKNIFKINQSSNNYGGFNLKLRKYNVDITTYRKELKYDNRHPIQVEYVSSLFEDIKRRDFTINSLCMDKNENIIDLLDAKKDLNNHLITIIGDPETKFIEDPLRMLRAIRFACILDFKIEDKTYESLVKNANLVSTLSNERIKEELSKILSTSNYQKGLSLLKDTKISDIINLKYDNIVPCNDLLGMWSQIECSRLEFTKTEKDNISKIKQILRMNRIDNFTLFNYGLYLSTVAAQIMGMDVKTVNKIYHNLPIKCMKDIDISAKDIMKILNIEPCKKIGEIILDVRNAILKLELKNKKSEIIKYVYRKWHHE